MVVPSWGHALAVRKFAYLFLLLCLYGEVGFAQTGTGGEAGLRFAVTAKQEGRELTLEMEISNATNESICLASASSYPRSELDEYGSTSFDVIGEDASPFYFSNYTAVLFPVGSRMRTTSKFKILPPSVADRLDLMGGSVEEQRSLREALRESIRRGEFEFGVSVVIVECPKRVSISVEPLGSPVIVKFSRRLSANAVKGFDVAFGAFKIQQ